MRKCPADVSFPAEEFELDRDQWTSQFSHLRRNHKPRSGPLNVKRLTNVYNLWSVRLYCLVSR